MATPRNKQYTDEELLEFLRLPPHEEIFTMILDFQIEQY